MADEPVELAEKRPTTALFPFDDDSADLVIRTCDSVDFYVHKIILSLASPFFRSMFTLPQPIELSPTRPIIDITENSPVVDAFLRIIYPNTDQEVDDLGAAFSVLETAMKYEAVKVEIRMKPLLLKFAEEQPLKVFAGACKLGVESLAGEAAQLWKLRRSNPPFTSSCQKCGWGSSCRCFERTIAGQCFIEEMSEISSYSFYFLMRICSASPPTSPTFCASRASDAEQDASGTRPPLELEEYLLTSNGDIILQSSDGAEIPMHKIMLEIASTDFDGTWGTHMVQNSSGDLPVVAVQEDHRTLAILCRLCYPTADVVGIANSQAASSVAAACVAAETYKMVGVAELARSILLEYVDHCPLEVFFYGKRYQWEDVIEEALPPCLSLESINSATSFTPAMNLVSAQVYYDLLKTHHESRNRTSSSGIFGSSVASSSSSTTSASYHFGSYVSQTSKKRKRRGGKGKGNYK